MLSDNVATELGAPSAITTDLLQCIDHTWAQPGYPADWLRLPSQRRWEYEITAAMLELPIASDILDTGAGQGYMSYVLSTKHNVLYNDRSDIYWQPPAPIQKIIGSFFTIPKRMTFDGIACVSVLEHVPSEHRAQWLEKTYDLLRPGGVVALTFEWHPDIVFDIGDGMTLVDAQVDELCATTRLKLTARIPSPIVAGNSRGWKPLALQFIREGA